MKQINKTPIFIALLVALLYFRTFTWLINAWLTEPPYSHGFLIPIISGVIAWMNIRKLDTDGQFESEETFKPGIFVFAFGLILYVVGFIELAPFVSAISFLFTVSGLIIYFYGRPMMRALLFPVTFLIFAVPLPFLMFEKITFVLQSLSACYSASCVKQLGIPVERIGAEIYLQDSTFIIGLPCSGIDTLLSLLALTAMLAYILRCRTYKKAFLFCAAIPVAVAANILRVTAILLVAHSYGAEAAMRFFHDFSNLFLFVIAFIFLILISITIRCKVKL